MTVNKKGRVPNLKKRSVSLLKLLTAHIIIVGSVLATDSFPILGSGECTYSGHSYCVYDSSLNYDSTYYIPYPHYEFGDRTPNQFDTDEIRRSVVRLLHPWLNSEDSSTNRDIEFYSTTVKLRAYWEFPNDTVNVLLRFDAETSPIGIAYFALNRNTHKVYPLLDQMGEVTKQYNTFLQENPNAFSLTPFCQTLLLLKLRYIAAPVFVIRNADEVVGANMGYDELISRDNSSRDWLYCEDIKQDTLLKNAYRAARKSKFLKDNEKEIRIALAEVSNPIFPPSTTVNGDTITTKMTVYNPYVGEIAWWESVILVGGKVLNLRNLRAPALSFDFCLNYDRWIHEERSPYHRTYSTAEEELNERPDSLILLKGCGPGPRITLRFELASVSIDLKSFANTLKADYRFPFSARDATYLPALISMISDSLNAGKSVNLDYRSLIFPLRPGLEFAIMSFLESGSVEITDVETGAAVDWIRQYYYSGMGLESYGARRFYLPSNRTIIDVVTWIS